MQQQEQKTRRDPLVGQFFIARGEDGRPVKAGRIRSRLPEGAYMITDYPAEGRPHGAMTTPAQMHAEHWEFYVNETDWRRAFARTQ